MSKNKDLSLKIIESVPTLGGKNTRISAIKELLHGSKLDPLLDYESNDTEAFVNTTIPNDIRNMVSKKTIDFGKIISQLGGRLLYIKSGSFGHTFKGIMIEGGRNKMEYAVKVVAYPKKKEYGDLYDSKRPENAEISMLKTLSYFVVNNQIPHIVLPVGTFNTSIKTFLSLSNRKNQVVNNKRYDQFIKRYRKGEYYPEVSILISEWANGGDLLEYIRKNYTTMKLVEWRAIFFQIIITLAFIQSKYPSFRHNDFKANNILIQNIQRIGKKRNNFVYKINNMPYIVPNIGIHIRMWDFDFASIPGIVNNSKVDANWTTAINVSYDKNRYYDLHYFFNTLTSKGFFPQFFEAKEVPISVKKFVNRVVPNKYREGKLITDRGRILINDEYIIPEELLKTDKFFSRYRKIQYGRGSNIPTVISTVKKSSRKSSKKSSRKSSKNIK